MLELPFVCAANHVAMFSHFINIKIVRQHLDCLSRMEVSSVNSGNLPDIYFLSATYPSTDGEKANY